MNQLEFLHKLAIGALAVGLVTLVATKIDDAKEHSEIRLAVTQAKQVERFTAADGRALCSILVTLHPEVRPQLPEVCNK